MEKGGILTLTYETTGGKTGKNKHGDQRTHAFRKLQTHTPSSNNATQSCIFASFENYPRHSCRFLSQLSCGICSDWETRSSASAWRAGNIQHAPPISLQTPFVFLHVPKTGGSTIRAQLVDAAASLGYRGERVAPVGGHQPRYELYDHKLSQRHLEVAALLAGHLTWGTLSKMASKTTRFDKSCSEHSTPAYTCLTIARHPIERTISYYYNRISKTPLNYRSPSELGAILSSFRKDGSRRFKGNFDEGPVQPTFKMLCGNWTAGANEWAVEKCSLETARQRLRSCYVGVLDDWAVSCGILSKQLPWMNLNCSAHENSHQESQTAKKSSAKGFPYHILVQHETRESIRPDLRAVIEGLNPIEMELYYEAQLILQEDSRLLQSKSWSGHRRAAALWNEAKGGL